MSKWIPKKRDDKQRASESNQSRADRMDSGKRKSPPGKGGDSQKNKGRHPNKKSRKDSSMTNNISDGSNKQPTISALNKAKSQFYRQRVKANKELRQATRERNALYRESRKLKKTRVNREALLQAQELLGNIEAIGDLKREINELSREIQENGYKRSGLSRTISHRQHVVEKAESRRSTIDKHIEKIREQRKPSKRKRTKGIPKSGVFPKPTEQAEVPEDVKPYPSQTRRGGDILVDDTAQDRVYHDYGVSHDSDAYIASGVTYPRILEHAPPTPFHDVLYQQNLADTIQKADDMGLLYDHDGEEVTISDALIKGADPQDIWDFIKDNFDGGTVMEKLPYKGIVNVK